MEVELDGWIFGVGIDEDKPIATQKIDCMVNMHMTPWLLCKHPGVVCRLGWLFLVLSTSSTSMAEVHDLGIHPWPVDCSACQ